VKHVDIPLYSIVKSIRASIAAYTSVAIILICTAIVAVALRVSEDLYIDAVSAHMKFMSASLTEDLLAQSSNNQIPVSALSTMLLKLERDENITYAAILDNAFETLESYSSDRSSNAIKLGSRFSSLPLVEHELGIKQIDSALIALLAFDEANEAKGYLLLVKDLSDPLVRNKTALLTSLLPIVLFISLFGLVLSSWQNFRMLRPLNQLTDFVRRVGQNNDYSIQLNVEGKQEIKVLSKAIKSMVKTIGEQSIKNRAHTEQLEKQQQTMERLANYDLLTGLPNRINFLSAASKVLANIDKATHNPALLSCDLDGFKAVNDLHGHNIGDKLLIEVSQRLKHCMRPSDVVSRAGGDEFLVLMVAPRTTEQLFASAQQVASRLSEPFHIDGWEINIGVSIGIACAKNSDYEVSKLISNANIAMHRSKLKGNSTYSIFERDMMSANKRRLDIANAIPAALKLKEFDLFYQAKVDKRHKVVGFEALLRWKSEELGTISPDEFIPIAEQSGRMTLITHWVINKVCEDFEKFQYEYGDKIVVAMNLSAYDLKDPSLFEVIEAAFNKHKINPQSIEFEVTESAFLDNFEQANQFFDQLAKIGSSVALDDFGTGYSSLSYLTKIKFNTLKIDKQFIDGIGISKRSTLVTKTIIEMAKNLNLKVCAEGVESEQQIAFLVDMNCDQLQGYYFSKPQPIELLLEISLS
jgi:diguanylate cyclase (GGDEF)-like protein